MLASKMIKEKIEFDLTGVPKTLLLPLFGRAKFSHVNGPFYDEHAVKMINSLNYDFENLSKQVGSTPLFWMARAFHFDQAIKAYLQKYPQAIIVNLGAGLETAFYRVDNHELTWIDLDLPEVIKLREAIIPSVNRVHSVARSVLDFSWMKEVKRFGEDIFFFAGGLLMYFQEKDVKSLFIEMAKHFPQSELIFDTISSKGLMYATTMLSQAGMDEAQLTWGIDDPEAMEKWSPNIKLATHFPYFSKLKMRFHFPLRTRLQMFFLDFVNKGNIVHLKFM